MRDTFRLSMAFLHTWIGLLAGFVLMAVFFFGSLSVFDREIDRWSVPETRTHAAPFPSFDKAVSPVIGTIRPDPLSMEIAQGQVVGDLPAADDLVLSDMGVYTNHRDPLWRVYGVFDVPNKPTDPVVDHVHVYGYAAIDPQTGERLPAELQNRLALGTGFFFPLHFMLNLQWKNAGYWIVFAAGMAMLVALVSGVVMHRKIFREFFTFRPHKARLRSVLDLHNMTGVLALPFLFLITLSGLLIFAYMFFPAPNELMNPLLVKQQGVEMAGTGLPFEPAGNAAPMAPVDPMLADARARWAAQGTPGDVGMVTVTHLGDADAYVSVSRDTVDRVASAETLHYAGGDGRLLYENPPAGAIKGTYDFLYGLHFQFFRHWPLRWLLFVGGLTGCACIATGFLFFVEKRRRRHVAARQPGARVADALAVTSVTGMLVATCAMLLANRVLPAGMSNFNEWQIGIFSGAWIAALAHAAIRARPAADGGLSPAWGEQCWAAGTLAIAAVLANWAGTGDHLLRTIGAGYWPVAGVDLVLLAGGGAAILTGWRLTRRAAHSRTQQADYGRPAHV